MPRILVTGGSGRLGTYVVVELAEAADVAVLDLAEPAPGVEHFAVDLLDTAGVRRAVEGCDAIVHVAGRDLLRGGTAEEFARANMLGSWSVLHAAREAGIGRVVQISSTSVYGFLDGEGVCPERLAVAEDHLLRPSSPYGMSKYLAEAVCEAASFRGGPDVVSLRVAMVAFPDMTAQMAEAASARAPGRLYAYAFPEDVARAVRLALSAEVEGWLPVNIASPDSYAAEPTLDVVRRLYGTLPAKVDRESFERDPMRSPFDMSRARELLGFTVERRWRDR